MIFDAGTLPGPLQITELTWFVVSTDGEAGEASETRSVTVDPALTSVSGRSASLPTQFRLHANCPNPFNPSTSIGFDIQEISEVPWKYMTC